MRAFGKPVSLGSLFHAKRPLLGPGFILDRSMRAAGQARSSLIFIGLGSIKLYLDYNFNHGGTQNTEMPMINTHMDVVGSLLRPAYLLRARQDHAAGRIAPAEFKEIEDRAVTDAIELQEQAGLEIVTDGEMRRLSFQSQMTEAVEGFGEYDINAFLWGEWHGDESLGDWKQERPPSLGVVSKLRRKRHLSVEEFVFLRARTDRCPKLSLPSPSLWANFWSGGLSERVYPTLDSFLADVVDILREEVTELARLGATYLQLDAPHYGLLLDPRTRAFYEDQGWDLDRWLSQGLEMDNAMMGSFTGVTFGFHL